MAQVRASATPQAGILPEAGNSALFLILRVLEPRRHGAAVAKAVSQVPAQVGALAGLDRRRRLAATVAVGSEYWDVLSPGHRPQGLRPFRAIADKAPNTGGDILLHVVSDRPDLNFELARRFAGALDGMVEVMDEVHGFRYLDSRDLTGFIDGTENPKGKARAPVALIGAEDSGFAGGSYVFTQRYVHNLRAWANLSRREQEGAIGRRKHDSQELSARSKPATAHISRVVIEENGEELAIVRHSFPYGTVSEHGLFFIAYTKDLGITERMLARMMGTAGDGLHDHLMDFTRAVSGATFFAPPLGALRRLGKS